MKILYIIESLGAGGKERRLLALIKGLIYTKNVEIQLVILSDRIHYKDVLDLDIKINKLARNIKKDSLIIQKFTKIVNQFKPNIVHCWDNIAAFHFGPVCKFKKIAFINSMITSAPVVSKLSKRYLSHAISYPFSDVILSNSQAGLDNFFAPKKKQKVIYNGFNFDRIASLQDKNNIYKKFNIAKDKPIVGMVATFSLKKDYLTLLQAALHGDGKFSCVLVGHGSEFDEMKAFVENNAIKNVYFLGRQQDVESIVNIFNIGVLLSDSSIHGEGISNSIMEYMALEKPVIATKGGGTAELVVDGETSFLIEPKNSKQLLEKILYLINNTEEAVIMGKKGKKRIEEFFSIDRMINETYQLYKKFI